LIPILFAYFSTCINIIILENIRIVHEKSTSIHYRIFTLCCGFLGCFILNCFLYCIFKILLLLSSTSFFPSKERLFSDWCKSIWFKSCSLLLNFLFNSLIIFFLFLSILLHLIPFLLRCKYIPLRQHMSIWAFDSTLRAFPSPTILLILNSSQEVQTCNNGIRHVFTSMSGINIHIYLSICCHFFNSTFTKGKSIFEQWGQ